MITRKTPLLLKLPKSLQLPTVYLGATLMGIMIVVVLLDISVILSVLHNADKAVKKFNRANNTFDVVAETWIRENAITDIVLNLPFVMMLSLVMAMVCVKYGYLILEKPLSTHKLINILSYFGWFVFLPIVCGVVYYKEGSFLLSQIFTMIFTPTLLLCLTFRNKLLIFIKLKQNPNKTK